MTNYTIDVPQVLTFVKSVNHHQLYEIAMCNHTGSGSGGTFCFATNNVDCEYNTNNVTEVKYCSASGSHTHSSKTGYKTVTIADGNLYYLTTTASTMPRNRSGTTHNLLPKCINSGSLNVTSGTQNWNIKHFHISDEIDSNDFLDYVYAYWQNPSKYKSSLNWFFPAGTLPPTLPIYFNDFYHIRTPLYKDGL